MLQTSRTTSQSAICNRYEGNRQPVSSGGWRDGGSLHRFFRFHMEQTTQNAAQGFGRFPYYDGHNRLLSSQQCLQQTAPQAIRRNATRKSSAPMGKIAAINIPAPSAAAKMPRSRCPQLCGIATTPFSFQYMPCGMNCDSPRSFCILRCSKG